MSLADIKNNDGKSYNDMTSRERLQYWYDEDLKKMPKWRRFFKSKSCKGFPIVIFIQDCWYWRSWISGVTLVVAMVVLIVFELISNHHGDVVKTKDLHQYEYIHNKSGYVYFELYKEEYEDGFTTERRRVISPQEYEKHTGVRK